MPEIGTSGSMSGERKRSAGHRPQATAPLLNSTISPSEGTRFRRQGLTEKSPLAPSSNSATAPAGLLSRAGCLRFTEIAGSAGGWRGLHPSKQCPPDHAAQPLQQLHAVVETSAPATSPVLLSRPRRFQRSPQHQRNDSATVHAVHAKVDAETRVWLTTVGAEEGAFFSATPPRFENVAQVGRQSPPPSRLSCSRSTPQSPAWAGMASRSLEDQARLAIAGPFRRGGSSTSTHRGVPFSRFSGSSFS